MNNRSSPPHSERQEYKFPLMFYHLYSSYISQHLKDKQPLNNRTLTLIERCEGILRILDSSSCFIYIAIKNKYVGANMNFIFCYFKLAFTSVTPFMIPCIKRNKKGKGTLSLIAFENSETEGQFWIMILLCSRCNIFWIQMDRNVWKPL